jgi:hypothetical protein
LNSYRTTSLDPELTYLAEALANPRPLERVRVDSIRASMRERAVAAVRRAIDPVQPAVISADRALETYTQHRRPDPTGWIRTPSHVISTSRDPEAVTGGHNLDARVTLFETSETVPRGSVAIRANARGERIVTLNPLDGGRVGNAVRTAAREDATQLKTSLERILHEPAPKPALRNAALRLPPTLGPAPVEADRGFVAAQLSSTAQRHGWALSGSPVPSEYTIANEAAVFVDREADYTFRVTLPGAEATYSASSYDAAVDVVAEALQGRAASARPLTVYFSDMDQADGSNFLRSLEVRTKAAGGNARASGFGRAERTPLARVRDTLGRHYDFKAAKVTESTIESVASGGQRLRMTVEVPAVEATRPPLRMRIALFFKERISDPIRRSVEQIVARIQGRTALRAAAPMTGADIAAAIRADLKALHPTLDADVRIDLGAGDFYVADATMGMFAHARS